MMPPQLKLAPVRKTVRVAAPPDRAFEVFAAGIGRWWPRSHSLCKAGLETIIIEPRVGGRWFERGVDGSECEIGKVLVWAPPARLVLAWQLTGEWIYDANASSEVEVKFVADGEGATRVDLEHRLIERTGGSAEKLRDQVDALNGWGGLLQIYSDQIQKEKQDG
jgi:uncharacterized protein YndB with AHSA1/START domain